MPADTAGTEGMSILAALTQLRDEIYSAQNAAIEAGRGPMFSIDEGELELKLVAKRERKREGSAKAAFKLFLLADAETSIAGSQTSTREAVQTLKIKFSSLSAKKDKGGDQRMGFGLASKEPTSTVIQARPGPQGKTKSTNQTRG